MTKAQRDDLIEEFMPEAAEIAAEFEDESMTEEDLLQESMLGLIEAVNRLSEMDQDEWPMSLEDMIHDEIRAQIQRAIEENHQLMKEDDRLVAQVELLNQSIDRLTEENGQKPNIDEIANDMEVSQETVLSILKLTGSTPDDDALMGPGRE